MDTPGLAEPRNTCGVKGRGRGHLQVSTPQNPRRAKDIKTTGTWKFHLNKRLKNRVAEVCIRMKYLPFTTPRINEVGKEFLTDVEIDTNMD